MSALILTSKPVVNYLGDLSSHYNVAFRPPRAANWIVGLPEDGNAALRYLAQTINGPFDADKLDYLFRDAYFSGLALSFDIDRLWASCKVGPYGDKGAKILTLHQASASPLIQVLFNKMSLFIIVYQHPKVRAAECMFQGVMEWLYDNNGQIAGRDMKRASDFLWVTDDTFFAEALKLPREQVLHKMIHNILYRRFLVRALTISGDTVQGVDANYSQLRKLNQSSGYGDRRRIAEAICTRANEIYLEETGKERKCNKYEVWLDLPPDPPKGGTDDIFVRTPNGDPRKVTDLFPMTYWADLYVSHMWRGHVFCSRDWQRQVNRASREVLERRFGVRFKPSADEQSHVVTAASGLLERMP